jgi:polysaccharide biosynthesis protein VpsQ
MATRRIPNLARALAFAFAALLIAMVVIANRGQGSQWWPFVGKIPYADKFGHLALFATLGFLCNLAFPRIRLHFLPRVITGITFVLFLLISLEELTQAFIPARTCDLADWLADLAGLASGQFAAICLLRSLPDKSSSTQPDHTP